LTKKIETIEAFGKHLIGLYACSLDVQSGIIVSGTLIDFNNETFFLTAGHCVREIEKLIKSGHKSEFKIIDWIGYEAKDKFAIPFSIELSRLLYIDDDERKLDFGLIRIGSYIANQMKFNGAKPIDTEHWAQQHNGKFSDEYFLIGFPAIHNPDPKTAIKVACIPAKLIESKSKSRAEKEFERLAFSPREAIDFDIKGMSGCPIFVLSEDKKLYWIVGIQNSWQKSESIIYGCSLPLLAALVIFAIEKSKKKKRNARTNLR
jgi:hypothetical protein